MMKCDCLEHKFVQPVCGFDENGNLILCGYDLCVQCGGCINRTYTSEEEKRIIDSVFKPTDENTGVSFAAVWGVNPCPGS